MAFSRRFLSRSNRLLTALIITAAITIIPIVYVMSAATIQPPPIEGLVPSPSSEELAAQPESRRWTLGAIVAGAIIALLTAAAGSWLAYMVWKKDGDAQDLTLKRYESAIAASMTENLKLRGQVATLETDASNASKNVASLQQAAADAKAKQQHVELLLSEQQERTAAAERVTEEVRRGNIKLEGALAEAVAGARLQAEELRRQNLDTESRLEKERLMRTALDISIRSRRVAVGKNERLDRAAKLPVSIMFEPTDAETAFLAHEISAALSRANWQVTVAGAEHGLPSGINIFNNTDEGTSVAVTLEEFLLANLLEASALRFWSSIAGPAPSEAAVKIAVGSRRDTHAGFELLEESFLSDWQFQTAEESRWEDLRRMLRLRKEWFPRRVVAPPPQVENEKK